VFFRKKVVVFKGVNGWVIGLFGLSEKNIKKEVDSPDYICRIVGLSIAVT